jgi:hypothetical protein
LILLLCSQIWAKDCVVHVPVLDTVPSYSEINLVR